MAINEQQNGYANVHFIDEILQLHLTWGQYIVTATTLLGILDSLVDARPLLGLVNDGIRDAALSR